MGSEESRDRSIPCSMFKSPNAVDPFYGCNNWYPIQSGDFVNEFANPHCPVVLENQTFSHLLHFPSDSSLVDIMVPKVSSFGSSFGHIAESSCHPNFDPNNGQNSEPSPYGKRKRKVSVGGASPKNDPSDNTFELPKEDDEKIQKFEQNIGPNYRSKPAVKDNSIGAEPSKENYIHVRAKRGQATNSHSLAERVRRERISERMRLLQELVPGCNKITGKAMMLDEIINYVQSLQRQVEFLSMKLATVNPELNVDIDRILSKDILHLRGNNPDARGIASGLSSSHLFPGCPQGTLNGAHGTTSPFHPSLPQHIWNNELQGILQMGFDPDPCVSSLGPNGLSKMEL